MPRPEGPPKIHVIDHMRYSIRRIADMLEVADPDIERGMWYNLTREDIDKLKDFFTIIEERIHDAMDSTRRLQPHEEGQHPAVPKPVGSGS